MKADIIYLKDFIHEGSNQELVLFIHGIFSSPAVFDLFYPILKEQGYSIYAVVLKGHGKDLKSITRVKYQEWIEQINTLLKQLSNKYKKIHVVGHSMGALLALTSSDHLVTKRILIAPSYCLKLTFQFIKLCLFAHRPNSKDNYIKGNQKRFCITFPKSIFKKAIALKSLWELFKLKLYTKSIIKKIDKPTYIIQSKSDECVSLRCPNKILKQINNINKEVFWIDKSYHAVYDETEVTLLTKKFIEYIKTCQ